MTTSELREKIAESPNPEWFATRKAIFNFPYIDFHEEFVGVSSIYEFVTQQISGWKNIEGLIPDELKKSIKYFEAIEAQIIKLFSFSNPADANLNGHWQNSVSAQINNIVNTPFLYNSPEIEFLIAVNKNYPSSFLGAFNFIKGQLTQNISDKDVFMGTLFAYEFKFKGDSEITGRRDAEKSSIDSIKSNFLKYIPESEKQLLEHLKNANENVRTHIQEIETFKREKEKTFNEWFEKSKTDSGQFNTDSNKKIKDLENAYDELLRLQKPADYWRVRASDLKKEGWKSLHWLIGLTLLACATLYSLLWLTPEGMLKALFSDDKGVALRWTIIFITFISFLAFGIRLLTKVTFSSFHLSRDAEEREKLTYVYLAMVKDASIDKEDRHLIMQSLFSRADTGLLKDDSAPTMPGVGNLFGKDR